MKIAHTRATLDAALSGALDSVQCEPDPIFGLAIPASCPGVPGDVLRPNLVDDTTTLSGEVTRTWLGEHAFVALNVEGRNQHDVVTASGRALVALPSSECGPVSLPLFGGNPEGFANLEV